MGRGADLHLEVLVEERSAEAALTALLPKMLPVGAHFRIVTFQGKPDLLAKLPTRLRAYRNWLPDHFRIVVLIDEDREACETLKGRLEEIAEEAGFGTLGSPDSQGRIQVLNRIAVEELEAWFFGDVTALRAAFPRVPATLHRRRGFRDPDAISGGTWEALERVLRRAGYYRGGMPKIETARWIARHMEPERNRSHSFSVFRSGLDRVVGGPG